jgi:hypothetical protein
LVTTLAEEFDERLYYLSNNWLSYLSNNWLSNVHDMVLPDRGTGKDRRRRHERRARTHQRAVSGRQ